MLLMFLVFVASIGVVAGTVTEGYSDWEYIRCIQMAGLREFSRRQYMPYREDVAEYACIEPYLYLQAPTPTIQLEEPQRNWLNSLVEDTLEDINNAAARLVPLRVRKEYRMLTDAERQAFISAVNQLKGDTQKYDALASLHVGDTARSAHRGPAFFTWNRLYMLLFETALKAYNPDVVLPYWDPTLDAALDDPKTSILWDDLFFGNGGGVVDRGPFSGWSVQGKPLIRNIGESGRLMRMEDVSRMIAKSRLGEITFPNAELENNVELHTYGVQMWVGGDMARLATAANDPIYFLLHTYTDCLWQKFRDNQTDPDTDWPWRYDGNSAHSVNAFLRILPDTRSRDVLTDRYGSDVYSCEEVPKCAVDSDCNPPYLTCDANTNRCITGVLGDQVVREVPCQGSIGYQNDYCLDDGVCDEAAWVYFPVEIIYNRPPDYGKYSARPLYSPTWVFNQDIYSPLRFRPSGYYRTVTRQRPFNPEYLDCKCKESDFGRVYVQSFGLSYMGSYREYVPVDRRVAVTSTVGYVAVKAPTTESTRSLIRVYDDCGRICTPICPPNNVNCSGVVEVTAGPVNNPGYGNTYEEAMYIAWDFSSNIPRRKNNFPLRFYCTFDSDWPFAAINFIPNPNEPEPTRPVDPDERPLTTTTTTVRTTTTTTTTTTTPPTTVLIEPNNCFNSSECYGEYEPTGCVRCAVDSFSPCPDKEPTRFRQCGLGEVWQIHNCPPGLVWDQEFKLCNYQFMILIRSTIGSRTRRLFGG